MSSALVPWKNGPGSSTSSLVMSPPSAVGSDTLARGHTGVWSGHGRRRGTSLPELLVDFIASLDGYGAAEGWPGWWGMEGPEYLGWLEEDPEKD